MTPNPADDILVQRAREGAQGAFAELASRHRAGLVRCITLLISDPDEAESLAQEVFARALAGLPSYRSGEHFYAWLRGIALNLSRQHLRRVGRHARATDPRCLEPAPAREGQRNGVLSGIFREELATRIWQAIAQLPEAYREAVVLHYVEEMNYDDLSALTGVAPATLRVRALRGRSLLRGELGPVVDTWLRSDPQDSRQSL